MPVDPSLLEQSIDEGQPLARYTIYVPVRDNNQREVPHVLDNLRQTLTNAGFPGRTVIRRAQGDWQGDETSYDTEEMDLVMIDAADDPQTLSAIRAAAQGVKDLAGQEAVYMTVHPLRTYLI
jgi:hypothetical protein